MAALRCFAFHGAAAIPALWLFLKALEKT